ncbi:MAG: sigma-70 family RNA polymerase sigma factor [Planctomycetota bacterium]
MSTIDTNPPPTAADEDFERFCRGRDMAALGRVFDATAPALYHVALHLRPSSWVAEDLVQTTFVTAIESAGRFERGRRVFPWLLGILSNHAREIYRTERPASLGADPAATATPFDAVRGQEVREHLPAAIEGLTEPYRTVVRQFLQDGLEPREIAHELRRPPSTVRGQLKRGLALLRRGLPAGLAPSAALLRLPERGLSDVRQNVLAHARASLAGTGAASAVPLGLMVALLVVMVVPIAVLGPRSTATDPGVETAIPVAGAAAEASRGDGDASPAPARTEAEGAAADARERPVASRVTGRAIDAVSGAPLADLAVELISINRIVAADRGGIGVERRVRTDRRGRFDLELAPDPADLGYALRVAVGEATRVMVQREYEQIALGECVRLGDVPVSRGGVLSGRVVDPVGQPVGDVRLRVDCPEPRFVRVVEGRFCTTGALPSGRWPVSAHGAGWSVVAPRFVEVAMPTSRVEVRVKQRPSIRGEVVDTRGIPVGGVVVRGEDPAALFTQTDDSGQFVLFAREGRATDDVRLVTEAWQLCPDTPPVTARWSARGVRLVVRRALRLPIRVVDPRGHPVTRFSVWAAPGTEADGVVRAARDVARYLSPPRRRHNGAHPGGRLDVDWLWPGWNVLRVWPEGRALAPSRVTPVWIEPGRREPLVVRLARSARLCVRVVDDARLPVAGAAVEAATAAPADRLDAAGGDARGVLDAVTTGSTGTAVLAIDAAAGPAQLRVRAPGYAPVRRDLASASGELEIVLAAAGQLIGCFTRPTCVRRVTLQSAAAAQPDALAAVESTGRFRVPDLAPGAYTLTGWYRTRWSVLGQHESRWVPADGAVAVVRIRRGQTTRLSLDPPRARAGRIRGQLTLASAVPPASWIYLERVADGDGREIGPFPVDGAGRFDVADLAPGRYRLRWSRAGALAAAVRQSVPAPNIVAVDGGATLDCRVDLEGGPLELQLVGGAATPVAQRFVRLRWQQASARVRTDAAGRAELGFVPAGRVEIEIEGRPRLTAAPFEIGPLAGGWRARSAVERPSR